MEKVRLFVRARRRRLLLTKPFGMAPELLARSKVVAMRRKARATSLGDSVIRIQGLKIDSSRRATYFSRTSA